VEHIAIDLGGRESQVCVRGTDGAVVYEGRFKTVAAKEFLQGRPKGRVILETCAESFAIAQIAQTVGHEVRVVPATLVKSLGVGQRRIKNDRRDAQILSEVSCRIDLPSVHVKSTRSQDLISLVGMRDSLVHARTQLINTVRGWLRGHLLKMRTGGTAQFGKCVRDLLLAHPEGMPVFVERQLVAIDGLCEQIKAATMEIEEFAENDAVCCRLMTVPGVGAITATRYVATLEDVTRFASAHQVESYLGLTPSERSSSDTERRGGITKAGSPTMRWLLIQAAWTLWRSQPEAPMVLWAKHVAERRGRWIAIVALARKLAGVLYAIWRDGTSYSADRAAEAITTPQ
jgi:transposase